MTLATTPPMMIGEPTCGVCFRCLARMAATDPPMCRYGGPFAGYQQVAEDGVTFIGPIIRVVR